MPNKDCTDSYPFTVWSGLLTPEHVHNIGPASWVYMWCIDRITKEEDGLGIVLGGKPVTYEDISRDLGIPVPTVRKHVSRLKAYGYLEIIRTQSAIKIFVTKSKKFKVSKNGHFQKSETPKNGLLDNSEVPKNGRLEQVEASKNGHSKHPKMDGETSKNGHSKRPKMDVSLDSTCNREFSVHDSKLDITETVNEDMSSLSIADVKNTFLQLISPTGLPYNVSKAIEYASHDYGIPAVIGAIKTAVKAGRRSWSYTNGILQHSSAEGTLDKLSGITSAEEGCEDDYESYVKR
ncbi:MAG: helix-turn-helix domain-containing protein [Armatimonadota bacterium]